MKDFTVFFYFIIEEATYEFSCKWKSPFFPSIGDSIELYSYLNDEELENIRKIKFYSKKTKKEIPLLNLILESEHGIIIKNIHHAGDSADIHLYTPLIDEYELKNIF